MYLIYLSLLYFFIFLFLFFSWRQSLSFVLGAFPAENSEAINPGHILVRLSSRHKFRKSLQENMGKRTAEVSAINVHKLYSGHINFFTSGTVDLGKI